ncbi:hypothetical protein RS84_01392 [Microbacterium hydrocarbonoxydans]|uniref:Diadenosine tetraphosphate (Ap4A) hydrolase n=1 Tax=Microbacterium hydrocarbonoxydans TaxID=273678 RepID=A0A0M2HTF7_9MICO|nr:hypothetical protein [Microbacterium hydrocarbonoxydans]KJL47764.1 hypothetical protein RS84_01392 [Microbacterium hydrocarbonoxydans]
MTDLDQHPADSAWHRWAPVGQTLDTARIPGSGPAPSIASFELLPLDEMLVPEKPRHGELDPSECGHCKPSRYTIWQDDDWQVSSGFEGGLGLPFVGSLAPRRHVRLEDAPIDVLSGLGPMLQRLSEATKAIPAVARCHFSRWNDGSAHLHLWAYARPAGMMQGRGAILPYWEQAMPAMPDDMLQDHLRIVAEALAAGGGEAFPHGRPASAD